MDTIFNNTPRIGLLFSHLFFIRCAFIAITITRLASLAIAKIQMSLIDTLYLNGTKYAVATEVRRLYWIPFDEWRYNYDDRDRRTSRGWAYNPAGNGPARDVASTRSMPQVYRVDPAHSISISPWAQDLLCELNPLLSRDKAIELLNKGVAWCNTTDRVFDIPRVCGGAVVEEKYIIGDRLYFKTILTDQPIPTAEYVLNNFLSYVATEVQPSGNTYLINRMGVDGVRHPVRMFMLTREPVWVWLDEVLRLPAGFVPPSPFWCPADGY